MQLWLTRRGKAGLRRLPPTYTHRYFRVIPPTGRISNGPTEAVNLLIKKIPPIDHGFRNFRIYRLRLLLYCGISWQTSRLDTTTSPSTTLGWKKV
jgi:hypothetical protein